MGGEEHVHKLPFCGEGFPRTGHSEKQAVGVFQFLPVRHDDVVGKGVQPVIDRLPVHAEFLRHEGNENGGAAGGQAPLYFNGVMAEGEAGKERLLLLKVQPFQGAVVFLYDS